MLQCLYAILPAINAADYITLTTDKQWHTDENTDIHSMVHLENIFWGKVDLVSVHFSLVSIYASALPGANHELVSLQYICLVNLL